MLLLAILCIVTISLPGRTDRVEDLLTEFYTAKATDVSELPDDLQKVRDFYQNIYGRYMTEEGFDNGIADRVFIRTARLAEELEVDIHVKKVSLFKVDTVKDFYGKTLYRYKYTVTGFRSDKPDGELVFTGTVNLVKSDGKWLVNSLTPDPMTLN